MARKLSQGWSARQDRSRTAGHNTDVEANSKSDEERLFGNGVHVRDRAYARAFTDEPQTALLTDF